MFELSIKDHIASAHFLRGYDGPCKDLHGHTWQIEVTIQSRDLNDIGLVVDFKELKKELKDFLSDLDHVNLNDLAVFHCENPSSENLAKYIYQEFSRRCQLRDPDGTSLKIVRVCVWESEQARVVYWE